MHHRRTTCTVNTSELEALGIKINSTLIKAIASTTEEVVLNAIKSLKEAMAKGKVANKPAFLLRGIQEAWIPGENYDKDVELSIFNDWYNLAYSLKIVSKEKELILFTDFISEYPLDKLRKMSANKN
ncbi:hypothetical protein [Umezakia ovalisporum]|uniref:Uncharacterized protein n=1 Tax=Umezakia ovalisporum FSS-43 TaxID=2740520 RepID=A0ABT6K8S5_9CYAN|nr:hypothetical protein [Umezakia ovalisporum]MDH6058773.1 hypothetical protein [Umezakia ovalisporum FSS-43]MDH6072059.1 hypothetical protein [Umezakia ovalisporum CobakiLakeA]MDH6082831.1 hypothetical protein [Umezakia ovalisporum FSS-44]MDH6096373.1 hypothetical protein [Umezakia ovalisporum CobakiLakeB]